MSDWRPLTALPDLRRVGVIALDTETKDDRLHAGMGSGWPFKAGYICGVSVAYHEGNELRAHYFPIRHPDSAILDAAQVFAWLRDLLSSDVRIVTQNGLYDFGWLRTEADIRMPSAERLDEIGALATLVDENRFKYGLSELCAWRGLAGKDAALLAEGASAIGLAKRDKPAANIWRMPARYVGPYAEQDAASTLALFENLDPVLDQEGTRNAYRLEVDLLPMVHEMRRRGVRIDTGAAARARDQLLQKRDAVFAELSEKLGATVSMDEIGRNKWLVQTFDKHGIEYPRTKKGNPSFTAGTTGWMHKHAHWLPQLVAKADKYNKAAVDFLEGHILGHVVNGRIHAEIHPHRSDEGGARSFRFSYSDPPLQQMAARDEEIAPLIRGVFLPEEGQVWAKPDISQQEFRLIVHYAVEMKLRGAQEAAERYRADPNTDFHGFVAEITKLGRAQAKSVNFAKIYGAGVRKFAAMVGVPESEARAIVRQYDLALPFINQLSERCKSAATKQGYLKLYDGARRHWDAWIAWVRWEKGAGPCAHDEAEQRIKDPSHPWYRKGPPHRADTHKALNALIQGSAARHTKLWMRACWCEGIVPLLQMHDSLDCSVASPEQAERVAQLGREAVTLEVPIQVDLKFGKSWGDAVHSWDELCNGIKVANTLLAGHLGFVSVEPEADHNTAVENSENSDNSSAMANEHDRADDHSQDQDSNAANGSGSSGAGAKAGTRSNTGNSSTDPELGPYVYRDARGNPHAKVVRTPNGRSRFTQQHWTGAAWHSGMSKRKLPYRLPELLAADPSDWVCITEGEKDAVNVAKLGFTATTNPNGAKGWNSAKLIPHLAHLKRFAVLEDNDAAGRERTKRIIKTLRILDPVPDIRVVSYPELPEGGDVSDWLTQDRSRGYTELLARIEAVPTGAELNEWDAGNLLGQGLPTPRPWLYGWQLCRGFASSLVAPGDIGKTTMRLTQAIELAIGRELLGHRIYQRSRVLVVTLEDDRNELWRRLLAICRHHHVDPAELKGWLFCAAINDAKLVEQSDGERVLGELGPMLRKAIERRQPDAVILDPFVKLHALDENSNPDMDFVCSQLVKLAQAYNIAIDSPAHTRKGQLTAGDSDNRRGASAQRDAGRLDYTLTAMTEAEAEQFGIDPDERKGYVRLDRAKANIVRAIKATWYRLVNVPLGNTTELYPEGDQVQALEVWVPPDAWIDLSADHINRILDKIDAGMLDDTGKPNGERYSGEGRALKRAAWKVVVEEMPTKADAQAKEIIRSWLKSGVLVSHDYESPAKREKIKGLFVDPTKRPT